MRTWDWELEARAMACDGLETNEDGNVTTPLIKYTRAVTAIRMTAAAYCLIHRQSPTKQEIAAYVDDNAKTAWLMQNAARMKPADADERHAIKEIDAWYKQEWREEPNPRPAVSGRILYYERAEIRRLIKRAADAAGESGYAPLEQLEHGSSFSGSGQEIRVLGVKVLLRGADSKGAAYAPSWNNPHPSGILGTLSSSNRTGKSRDCVTNWRATRACIVRTAACSVRSSGWSARTST